MAPDLPRHPIPATADEKREANVRVSKRRAQVADLVLQRVPLRKIAERLEVSKRTVLKDVAKLKAAWSRDAGTRIDLHVGTELASLNQDEFALRLAMAAETEPRKRLAFFDRIMGIGVERRKLLGLDAAAKVGISFEGSAEAVLEVRDREFYQAMLADPETRAILLAKWRKGAGMPEAGAQAQPALPNGNGRAHG